MPLCYGADPVLGQWVERQRKALKSGTLTPDRLARLHRVVFQATQGPAGTWQAGPRFLVFEQLIKTLHSLRHAELIPVLELMKGGIPLEDARKLVFSL